MAQLALPKGCYPPNQNQITGKFLVVSPSERGWTIAVRKTGLPVCHCFNKTQAIRLAKALADLPGWADDPVKMAKRSGFFADVQRVIRRYRGQVDAEAGVMGTRRMVYEEEI